MWRKGLVENVMWGRGLTENVRIPSYGEEARAQPGGASATRKGAEAYPGQS